jgi:hypothetical protein
MGGGWIGAQWEVDMYGVMHVKDQAAVSIGEALLTLSVFG